MDAVDEAKKAVTAAQGLQTTHMNLTGDTPGGALLSALLESDEDEADDGLALVNAISSVDSKVNSLQDQLTDNEGNPIDLSDLGSSDAVMALTAMDDPDTMEDETGPITRNANDITALDGRVADNESDIGGIKTDLYGDTSGQHDDATACAAGAGGLVNIANCADARSRHNEEDIDDVNDKLMQKKEYIDNLAAEIGVDPVTGEGTGEGRHEPHRHERASHHRRS